MGNLRIVIYTAIMVIAIIFGKKGYFKSILKKRIHNLQNILVFCLLFVMGVTLGKNEKFINSITAIWLKALIMTISIIIFSIIVLFLSNKMYYFISKKNKSKKNN